MEQAVSEAAMRINIGRRAAATGSPEEARADYPAMITLTDLATFSA
jgi:hypothetical protein